jgi:hypothetical protein
MLAVVGAGCTRSQEHRLWAVVILMNNGHVQ